MFNVVVLEICVKILMRDISKVLWRYSMGVNLNEESTNKKHFLVHDFANNKSYSSGDGVTWATQMILQL